MAISMIKYIGDLSKQDAQVLRELSEKYSRIVEFGCGGSTQILGHYTDGKVISYDTSAEWIARTKKNLKSLAIGNVEFVLMSPTGTHVPENDFLFVDGLRGYRVKFAFKAWDSSKVVAFHDTRRRLYTDHICSLIQSKWNDIDHIDFNYKNSNITIIYKREQQIAYEDWNKKENRTKEEIGIA